MSNFWWEGTEISLSLSLNLLWSPNRSRKNAWRLPLLSFRDRLFCCLSFVSWRPMRMFNQRMFSHCSTNTSPISNKERAIQWLPPCMPPWKHFGERKSRKETGLKNSSAFSSKMWYSRVICVFLRWGLTYIFDMYYGVNCPLSSSSHIAIGARQATGPGTIWL